MTTSIIIVCLITFIWRVLLALNKNHPYNQWVRNVKDHPEDFKIYDNTWVDGRTGWKANTNSMNPLYSLISPEGGEISIGIINHLRMYHLINWWSTGSLKQGLPVKEPHKPLFGEEKVR